MKKNSVGLAALAGFLLWLAGAAGAEEGMYYPFPLQVPARTYVIDYQSHHAPLEQVTVTGERIEVVYRTASYSPFGRDFGLDLRTGRLSFALRSYSGSVVSDEVPPPEIGRRFFAYLNILVVMRAHVSEIEKNDNAPLAGLTRFLDQAIALVEGRDYPGIDEVSVNTPAELFDTQLPLPVLHNDWKRLGFAEVFGGRYKLSGPAQALLTVQDSTQVYTQARIPLPGGYGQVEQLLDLPEAMSDPTSARFSLQILAKDSSPEGVLAQASYAITQLLPAYSVAPHTYVDDQGKLSWPALGKTFWIEIGYSTLRPAVVGYEIRDEQGSVLLRATARVLPAKEGTTRIQIPVLPVLSGHFYPVSVTLRSDSNSADLLASFDTDIFYP